MEKNIPNPEQLEEKKWFQDVLKYFEQEDVFKVLDKNPEVDNVDRNEAEKIIDRWKKDKPELLLVQYTLDPEGEEEYDNPIDKIKVLLWKQEPPLERESKKEAKIEPERNRYEGVVGKMRRVKSKSGYDNEKFYLSEDGNFSDLKSYIRLNF